MKRSGGWGGQVFYVEAISNPLAQVADLEGVAHFCKAKGLTAVVDATLASPVLLRAAALGFHLVLHSATKYLNGHSDILAGAACGPASLIQNVCPLSGEAGMLDPDCAVGIRMLRFASSGPLGPPVSALYSTN